MLATASLVVPGTYAAWSDFDVIEGNSVGADVWEPDEVEFRIIVCQTINVGEQGRVRVLIPQTAAFNPMDLDVTTLRFGAEGHEVAPVLEDKGLGGVCEPGPARGRVLYFDMPVPELTPDDTHGCVIGALLDGSPGRGCTTLEYSSSPRPALLEDSEVEQTRDDLEKSAAEAEAPTDVPVPDGDVTDDERPLDTSGDGTGRTTEQRPGETDRGAYLDDTTVEESQPIQPAEAPTVDVDVDEPAGVERRP
ncbi:hypothetical protein [Egicoccus sp. AB-alg2]|uniref:hypothetical protein n=1 Tax=Egicoccus sp. AB-alg2 TaxID=3242693 RepID=UPI00359E1E7A